MVASCSSSISELDTGVYTPEATDTLPTQPPSDIVESDQDIWEAGLLAWRTPREEIDAACVNCHAPDAFDLAMLDFSDDTLRRRSVGDGLSEEMVEDIVALVRLQRERYNIAAPPNPREFRLLQPGGEVLPGDTSEAREIAFFDELAAVAPGITVNEVDSLADAKVALQEVADIDLSELRIGIPLPLWSSDNFHGEEFGTPDEWVNSIPCKPIGEAYVQAQNTYVLDPSRENFWEMYNALEGTTCNLEAVAEGLSGPRIEGAKHRAVLIGQHLMREQALGIEGFAELPLAFTEYADSYMDGYTERKRNLLPQNDAFWDVAVRARKPIASAKINVGGPVSEGLKLMGYPDFVVDSAPANVSMRTFQDEMERSWSWMHHQLDDLRDGGYFRTDTAITGYPLHGSFKGAHHMAVSYLDYGKKFNPVFPWYSREFTSYQENPDHFAGLQALEANWSWINLYMGVDAAQRNDYKYDQADQATSEELTLESFNDVVDGMRKSKLLIVEAGLPRADEAEALMASFCQAAMDNGQVRYSSVEACVAGSDDHHNNGQN